MADGIPQARWHAENNDEESRWAKLIRKQVFGDD